MARHAIKSIFLAALVSSFALKVSGEKESDKQWYHQESPRYNVQLSGTTRLDSLSSSVANVWSLISSGLIAAFLVTGGIYFFGVTEGLLGGSKASRRVSKQSGGYYDTQYYGGQYGDPYGGQYGGQYQDRWGRRQDGVSQQLDKIMSALSVDSVQDIVSGVKHGILGSLSSVRDDGLRRVDDVQSSITNTIDSGLDAIGGGSKLEDCFLQAVCYLTPDDEGSEEAGESRRNKDKQKRRDEKRRQKQNKKKNKNKKKKVEVVEDDYEDYEDYEEDYDYDEEVAETSDADTDDDYDYDGDGAVTSDDCQVFKCDLVKHGYTAFQLYNKVQNLRSRFSALREEDA